MGIDALGRLIKINPDIAEEHQLAVIDCLEVRCSYFLIYFYHQQWTMANSISKRSTKDKDHTQSESKQMILMTDREKKVKGPKSKMLLFLKSI